MANSLLTGGAETPFMRELSALLHRRRATLAGLYYEPRDRAIRVVASNGHQFAELVLEVDRLQDNNMTPLQVANELAAILEDQGVWTDPAATADNAGRRRMGALERENEELRKEIVKVTEANRKLTLENVALRQSLTGSAAGRRINLRRSRNADGNDE